MNIDQLIDRSRVAWNDPAASKKRSLQKAAELLAQTSPDLDPDAIFDALIGRERLGSTGLGHGVAIPHGRVPGHEQTAAAFVKLAHGVDFDAADHAPVDLLFALLVPEHATEEHLKVLAQIAEMFSDEHFVRALRESHDARQLFDLLTHWRSARPRVTTNPS